MEPPGGKPDVLKKIDALLTRHRTGSPAQQDPASAGKQAGRESIPVLTEAITEDGRIPVLTEALPATKGGTDRSVSSSSSAEPTGTGSRRADIPDEESMRRIEDFMVRELEKRIALEFTATLDHALSKLLEHSREHIRHAVREALKQGPDILSRDMDDSSDRL